ncbi:diguanylate cyclase [Actinotalea sp. M2MS4P-6]|uniref:histidine kinase N-terminal 7TM domain-containing diguanylate cyclase n=1 Tax=Actinotalea sp. M2MS4P-6 TaxID=2983762 RepID=UPI0021E3BA6C|nr:diguanylate cyclase [Actinotalea sp. M2MS4P-6]MCV2395867.1 diguanylate cyclase [Actinotalea sp. M2MS4P-6]
MGPQVVFALAVALGVPACLAMLWRARSEQGVWPSVVLLAGGALWSAAGLAMTMTPDVELERQIYAWSAPVFGVAAAAIVWQALTMTGRRPGRSPWLVAALALEPAVMVVVAAVPALTARLARVGTGPDGVTHLVNGPLVYVHTAVAGGMAVLGGALLVAGRSRVVTGHQGRFAVAALAMGAPTAAALAGVALVRDPVLVVAAASAGYVATIAILGSRLVRSRDLGVPLGVHQVLGALGDAVLVTDASGIVAQANPAARAMLGRWSPDGPEGKHWSAVLTPELAEALRRSGTVTAPDGTVLDVRTTEIRTGRSTVATVAVARDVTELELLRTQLAEQALRDDLTGLHNRRHLDQVLGERDLLGGSTTLTAAMVDIDRFKSVNDRHGHAVGDQVIIAVAGVLSRDLRADDVLVRFGGEEFLALLPGAAVDDVRDRAEEWRRACSALTVVSERGPVAVTVSIGLAQAEPGDDADDLLRRADAALYAAKRAGRDQVVGPVTGGGAA